MVTLAVRVNLSREVDGKLLIASHASMWYMSVYICVPHVHNPGVQEDFTDSTLKRKIVVLENSHGGY